MFKRLATSTVFIALASAPAMAHINPAVHGSLGTGILHPLSGLDHVLVMIAVGLWACLCGGKSLWVVPTAFVVTMLAGFGLAIGGAPLPFVEPAILASVVALGLLVAMAVRVPVVPAAAIVGMFALFHGYAHGSAIGGADEAAYALGFAASTAVLHVAGLAIGFGIRALAGQNSKRGQLVAQALGAVTALAGLALMAG
ncbi:MAG TPA: HupE/UreJ family protein [Rhizobiales bacterium]|nr:HupE/UreJ family protein [Hyphomicrobiales bacterium]